MLTLLLIACFATSGSLQGFVEAAASTEADEAVLEHSY